MDMKTKPNDLNGYQRAALGHMMWLHAALFKNKPENLFQVAGDMYGTDKPCDETFELSAHTTTLRVTIKIEDVSDEDKTNARDDVIKELQRRIAELEEERDNLYEQLSGCDDD